MRTLYLECSMGAAGDMLMAALYDLMDEGQRALFLERMNALGLEGVRVEAERGASHGISGTHMHVYVHGTEEGHGHDHEHGRQHHHHGEGHEHCHHHHHEHEHCHEHGHGHGHHHHHEHATPGHVAELIGGLAVDERVRAHARAVYDAIAEAEAKAHGVPVSDVHYHEVGALDAVADVTGVCLALDMLAPDAVVASPVHVGSGTVECAHGVVPVPAPATAELLRGVPSYGGEVAGELCTPTGAALLSHFAASFGPMPVMACDAVGVGVGTREFGRANVVRAFLGEATGSGNGEICEVVCNIDDMSAEDLGYASARLIERGALDAYVLSGTMKKGRPAHELCVLCDPAVVDDVARAVLEETTSNGLRVRTCRKWSLDPRVEEVETAWGPARVKVSEGFGIRHVKPEHDDVRRIARENGLPASDVRDAIRAAWERGRA